MKGKRQHIPGRALSRTCSFLQPRKVVSLFATLALACSLFPTYAFADSTSSDTSGSTTLSAAAVSTETPSTLSEITSTLDETSTALSAAVAQDESTAASTEERTDHLATTVNDTAIEEIEIGSEPLNLIQNGTYSPTDTAATTSQKAGVAGVNYPTDEQHDRLVARLNSALVNVSYSSYNGNSSWCVLDVSDIEATLTSNATSYAKSLVEEVINANPDIFYAGASYGAGTTTKYTSSGYRVIISKILVQYYWTPSTIKNSMKASYETNIKNMLKWVPPSGTDAQKAKAVHDWLVRNCKYNYAAYLAGGPTKYGKWNPWSAYGALVDKSPVCEGYSLAFMAAMNRLGIQSSFVTNSGHGWNRVRLNVNGTYYWFNLDITWDDPLNATNKYADNGYYATPSTKYFLKSDTYFKTKLGEGSNGQHSKWTPSGVAGTNTVYDYTSWGSYSSAYTMTVTSVSLSPTSVTIADDDSKQLTLTARGTNINTGLATWTSSNTNVVTVSASGLVSSGKTTGTATITVDLGGKKASCTVTVKAGVRLSRASVTVTTSASNLVYKSGVVRKPSFKVLLNGSTLKEGTDYTVAWPYDSINPGTKTATLTGKGNYVGTTTASYTITGNLSNCSKTGSGFSNGVLTTAYSGAAQKKAPTLTFNGSLNVKYTLKEGTDYIVTYPSNCTTPGRKTGIITGRGAWKGSYTYTLNITSLNIAKASITVPDMTYTGKVRKPSPVVTYNGGTIPKSAYKLTYKNNKNVGKGSVTITGTGGYVTGSITKTFNIVPKGTTLSKLTAASKGFTVKWKKQAKQTTGYQIQYSLKKNFSSGNKTVTIKSAKTTSKKISKLKAKKRYYVHIRTYKKVGGKTYYSAWSKTKSIVTK